MNLSDNFKNVQRLYRDPYAGWDLHIDLLKGDSKLTEEPDGRISTRCSLAVNRSSFKRNELNGTIGVRLKSVEGSFNVSTCGLTTLDGCPELITGAFNCTFNQLKNLTGGPITVKGNCNCYANELTSLEGLPIKVGGDFSLSLYSEPSTPILRLIPLDCRFVRVEHVANNAGVIDLSDYLEGEITRYRDMSKGINSKRAIWEFQKELIANGFEQYAKW
jgi:hypothetical protein